MRLSASESGIPCVLELSCTGRISREYDEDHVVTISEDERNYYLARGRDKPSSLRSSRRNRQYHNLHDRYGQYGDAFDEDFEYILTPEEDAMLQDSIHV